jgi:DNA-binding response OmpR family regulator
MTIATAVRQELLVTDVANQCSVLFVSPYGPATVHRTTLEAFGFRVTEASDWPDDERAALNHQVVIVRIREIHGAPMLAARLRAKPRFGQRVLIALVAGASTMQQRLAACASGFDDVLMDTCDSRQLTASILKRLRSRPEYRCFLPDRRNSAA